MSQNSIRLLGLLGVFLAAWCSEGYFHPDEHFQILEMAAWKYGITPGSALPWEFDAQMRPALQPVLAWGVIKASDWAAGFQPFHIAFLLRFITGLLFIWVVRQSDKTFPSSRSFVPFVLLVWFFPLLSVRFSSENYASLTLMAALIALQQRPSKAIMAGLWLGLSFQFRYQMGFAVIGILAWLLWEKRNRDAVKIIIGMAPGLVLGVIADRWFYGYWVFPPWNYFYQNLIAGKAAEFGTEPFWWYLTAFLEKGILPVGALLLYGAIRGIRKHHRHLFTAVLITFIIGHSLIGHKELRFLFPVIIPFLWLSAEGLASLWLQWRAQRMNRWLLYLTAGINILLWSYVSLTPAVPSIGAFRYIWNHTAATQGQQYYALGAHPYQWVSVPVYFYRPPSLKVHILKAETHLDSIPSGGKLIVEQPFLDDNDAWQRQYTALPDWLRPFNFNNWQSRTTFWTIYEKK